MTNNPYNKAKELLVEASSDFGFLASANNISNYKRVWARDGVICGLAALLDGDKILVSTFKKTLITLADHQHNLGHIPSNVYYGKSGVELSFGGLAGRVDTISWFIIGVANYVHFTGDTEFLDEMIPKINKGLWLLNAWEFNNNHLIYVPRSGNWADEYITEGHTFYDQVLRLWALRTINHLTPKIEYQEKINIVTKKLVINYKSGTHNNVFHPKAYSKMPESKFWQASITPSGYQNMFDAFGNSLAIFLELGETSFRNKVIQNSEVLRKKLPLGLLPAFWDPIKKGDKQWDLLENNCKYEFRNYPYTFHNGGTWQMVNSFYGVSIVENNSINAQQVLSNIEALNEVEDYAFYENFNTKTKEPNGVSKCTWSASGQVMLSQYLKGKKLLK